MYPEIENKLNQTLMVDPIYQQLLAACLDAEADYLRICHQLSPDDSAALDCYLSFCEEMEHRKLSLLLELAASG